MNYVEYFDSDDIILPAAGEKREVIDQLAQLAARRTGAVDPEELAQRLWYREQLMSTGIGLGLGVPHVRHESISRPYVAMAISPEGIRNYDSMDGRMVQVAVLILVGAGEHKTHVKLLSEITRGFKNPELLPKLCAADDNAQAFDILKEVLR